jgi:rubredoxin
MPSNFSLFKCEECPYVFETEEGLKTHIGCVHEPSRSQDGALYHEYDAHWPKMTPGDLDNETPWMKCEECGYNFKTQDEQNMHMKCVHSNADTKKKFLGTLVSCLMYSS